MLNNNDITMFKIDLNKLVAEYKRCNISMIKEIIKQEIDILLDVINKQNNPKRNLNK
ncbi:hypothetical protein CV093_04650 [Oceanobacillus sp. 143]|uniref:hypothetical protein n=1 Tax=Oceanobacillus zhaokaii TaxID=2052660 RepID=UPI0013195E99|nr:hypothetical protein [Oceanobacillus zhaokaii]QGS68181.1 hypothetical protein CV093_04650 [Oceanobacillus sp. 143]